MEEDDEVSEGMNRATWLTGLWLSNDSNAYEYWQHATRNAWDEARTSKQVTEFGWSRRDTARVLLAERLQKEITESAPTDEASLFSDLVSYVLSDVDWRRIALEFLQELFDEFDPLETVQCARGDLEP